MKRARAAVNKTMINTYFDNLSESLKDIPACNIINYDETNFTDDPGVVKVVVKRGVKHTERILDSSKTSMSVMVAAAANGVVLPPYTVYKSKHIYPTWIEGGIVGAGYNRNSSGWFDLEMFEDWFEKILLPYIHRLEGQFAIIGDNLSSHISLNVIRLCEANNIQFILLPPNATHLCQPLDVAFFRPLKIAWRNVLDDWKRNNRGVITKSVFPTMLKKAFDKVGVNTAHNVIAGFEACGIFPLNRDKVLKKIPHLSDDEDDTADAGRKWSDSFVEHLQKARVGETSKTTSRPRGKRLNIAAGKGIVIRDLIDDEEESSEEAPASDTIDSEQDNDNDSDSEVNEPEREIVKNDFVLVMFPTGKRDRYFVGKVLDISDDDFELSFLRKKIGNKGVFFSFPGVPDIQVTPKSQVIERLVSVDMRRGRYSFPKLNLSNIE